MSTQIELLIALLALLAGVLYAWFAVAGWRPWRLASASGRRGPAQDFGDTMPSVLFQDTDNANNQPVQ